MSDQAANDLVLQYQDYMKSLARNVHKKLPAHVSIDDIVGYGQIGLAEAASRFEFGSGASFETFAYYRIRGSIFDGIKKMSGATRGVKQWAKQQSALDEVSTDMASTHRASTHRASTMPNSNDAVALADHLGEGVKRLAMVITLANLPEENPPEPVDPHVPDQNAEQRELVDRVKRAIKALPDEDAEIIKDFYFDEMTMTEIANKRGVNKSTVSRSHGRILATLLNCFTEVAQK